MCIFTNKISITKADKDNSDDILKLGTSKAPKMASGFQDEFKLKKEILDDIPTSLVDGDVDQLLLDLDLVDNKTSMPGFRGELVDSIEAGSSSTVPVAANALDEAPGPNIVFRFNKYDTNIVTFVKNYQLELITRVNKTQRSIVRRELKKAIRGGENPITMARQIRPHLGLSDDLSRHLSTFKAALESGESAQIKKLLNRQLRDKRFDARLKRMIDGEKLAEADIQKMVDRYAERALKYRAERIARTEGLRAVHAGQHLTWKQAAEQGGLDDDLVRRFWIAANDNRTRATHAAVAGDHLNGVGLDEPFKTAFGDVLYPPGEPLCRCTVFYRIMERDSKGNIIFF